LILFSSKTLLVDMLNYIKELQKVSKVSTVLVTLPPRTGNLGYTSIWK